MPEVTIIDIAPAYKGIADLIGEDAAKNVESLDDGGFCINPFQSQIDSLESEWVRMQ